ncbi:MAG: hypothetical protein EKK52_07910 [Burkholderiales bacterium]|nr:MAG: hypothetical protein EKK52_07910 [Burkholderiales bacterium]
MKLRIALTLATTVASLAPPARAAEPVRVLFVGNSYTFGRVDPVLHYNAAAVHDLTAGFNAINPSGTNSHPPGSADGGSFEPHPWGGVPAIVKKMTDEAGLNYEVSLSTRNATSLRTHFLNLANRDWKLRENVASQRWDVVVLQELSDAALPAGMSKNANLPTFNAYADQFERFIHQGEAQTYTEAKLFGSVSACLATGLRAASCHATHRIAANPNASATTRVYLEQTWARPDMVEAHRITKHDLRSADGRPVVDTGAAGGQAPLYYTSLARMTADLHAAFFGKAAANPGFAGVVPVGDAFQRAVDQGLAQGSGFYDADGRFTEGPRGPISLWWLDRTHASRYGSYLSALVLFGQLTGRDPRTLGASEQAASELGIAPDTAQALQAVASEQLRTGTRPGSEPAR